MTFLEELEVLDKTKGKFNSRCTICKKPFNGTTKTCGDSKCKSKQQSLSRSGIVPPNRVPIHYSTRKREVINLDEV